MRPLRWKMRNLRWWRRRRPAGITFRDGSTFTPAPGARVGIVTAAGGGGGGSNPASIGGGPAGWFGAGTGGGGTGGRPVVIEIGAGGGANPDARPTPNRTERPEPEEQFVQWFNAERWFSHEDGDFVLDAILTCPLPILLTALGGTRADWADAMYRNAEHKAHHWRFIELPDTEVTA